MVVYPITGAKALPTLETDHCRRPAASHSTTVEDEVELEVGVPGSLAVEL
jgi:hypothetical protein